MDTSQGKEQSTGRQLLILIGFVGVLCSVVLLSSGNDAHNRTNTREIRHSNQHHVERLRPGSAPSQPDSGLPLSTQASRRALHTIEISHGTPDDSLEEVQEALASHIQQYGLQRPHPGRPFEQRIAYLKTHKTASSTIGSVMLRFATRHGLRMFKRGKHFEHIWKLEQMGNLVPKELEHTTEIANHHVSSKGKLMVSFHNMTVFYDKIMVHPYKLITILREPLSHYVSWYWYYVDPSKVYKHDFRHFVETRSNPNPLAQEFGLHKEPELLPDLLRNISSGKFFDLVLLSNRMTDSLVVMQQLFNWRLLDIMFLNLLDSHTKEGQLRYDNATIKPTPRLTEIDPDLLEGVKSLTTMDQALYEAANQRLDRLIAELGDKFTLAREKFVALQRLLSIYCRKTLDIHAADPFCHWYHLKDFEYERLARPNGYAVNVTEPKLGV